MIGEVNPPQVQWTGLAPGVPPGWSGFLPCQVSMLNLSGPEPETKTHFTFLRCHGAQTTESHTVPLSCFTCKLKNWPVRTTVLPTAYFFTRFSKANTQTPALTVLTAENQNFLHKRRNWVSQFFSDSTKTRTHSQKNTYKACLTLTNKYSEPVPAKSLPQSVYNTHNCILSRTVHAVHILKLERYRED